MTGPWNLLFYDVLVTVTALFLYGPYAQAPAHFIASHEMPKQSPELKISLISSFTSNEATMLIIYEL